MYADILGKKLLEQESVYQAFKNKEDTTVCYKKEIDRTYGQKDANYINRMRLSYYIFYEKIDDEDTIRALFEEEMKDRTTNAFQGIGNTILVLSCLLKKYNHNGKYDTLFEQAKNANFDCFCGYNADIQLNDDIYGNDLLDCIYLALDLDYKDIAETFVEELKEGITDWTESDIEKMLRFNQRLGKESENEVFHLRIFSLKRDEKGINNLASSYKRIIQYYINVKKYDDAYHYLDELLKNHDLEEIKHIRLFASLLEAGCEIICNKPDAANSLWSWVKPELQNKRQMFGNLYKKSIAAAKAVGDPFYEKLETDYQNWKQEFSI